MITPGTFKISISYYYDDDIEETINLPPIDLTKEKNFEDWFNTTHLEKIVGEILHHKMSVYCINMKYYATSSK